MNKYEKKVRRKLARMKPCPFCAKTPNVSAHVDSEYSAHGSIGHFVSQERCCSVMGMGRNDLFFCNDFKAADYRLWASMVSRFVDDCNRRSL